MDIDIDGEQLAKIAGIFTLLGTFLFTWIGFGSFYANGIGGAINLVFIILNASFYGAILGIPFWAVYLVLGLVGLTIISGFLQLAGARNEKTALVGSIMPLFVSIVILLDSFGLLSVVGFFSGFSSLFETNLSLVTGLLPFSLHIPVLNVSIGLIVLLAGGILGMVSVFLPRDEFYF